MLHMVSNLGCRNGARPSGRELNIRKELRYISELKERLKRGEKLESLQRPKVARESVLRCELRDLLEKKCCYYSVHAQRPEHRPRRGRGELASIIQLARDGQHGPGACDWQGRPGATLLARVRRPRRKVRLQKTPIWRLGERQRRGRSVEASCG